MDTVPSGTVTLLFTDIEGSTRLLQRAGEAYADLLGCHRELLRTAFVAHGGHEFGAEGDSLFVAFDSARAAVAAAADGQRALAGHPWPEGCAVRVRMGLHTGEPRLVEGDYVGIDVHHTSRVMAAGHGGQVLLTQTTRELLGDAADVRDLGAHRLKDLLGPQRLYQLEVDRLPTIFPALRTLEDRLTNLPVQPTRLIGRERELERVAALLHDEARLVTLTGPGGTGKTRLALQAAADRVDDFCDGVVFVPLAPVRDAAQVIPTVVQTLGLRERPGQAVAETLSIHLRDRAMLLVLDNLEQVIDAAATIAALLAFAPRLRLLATSRAPLRIAAEHVFDVPPLSEVDAARLFVERARAAGSDFAGTGRDAVNKICARLDGLPLAIELAAARMRVLSPRALLARLDQQLSVLTGGGRDLDQRQQTLRATIQWSYDLLSPEEQALFVRLSVFVGGWRSEAAEAVCDPGRELAADTLDGLSSLVEQSLLRRSDDPDGEPRFWMLETIREFAAERQDASGDGHAVRERHARHYLRLARDADEGLEGPDWDEWRDRLEADFGNLRAAVEWAIDTGDAVLALSLATSLHVFLLEQWRPLEAQSWLTAALGIATDRTPRALRAAALLARSRTSARNQGDRADAEAALALYENLGNVMGVAECLVARGFHEVGERRFAAADRCADEAERRLRAAGLDARLPGLIMLRVLAATAFDEASTRGDRAIRALRDIGAVRLVGHVYANLAIIALDEGRLQDSLALARAALERAVAARNETAIADARGTEGHAALALGDLGPAARAFAAELRICRRLAYFELVPDALLGVAAIAAEHRDIERSALLAGAARAALERRRDLVYLPSDDLAPRVWARHLEPACRSAPGEWEACQQAGEELPDDLAIEAALAYCDDASARRPARGAEVANHR